MKRLFLVLISGILTGLATPSLSASYLALVFLAPLWIALFDLDWFLTQRGVETLVGVRAGAKKGVKAGLKLSRSPAILGATWGLGYHGLTLFWITGIHPMTWMGVPWLASLLIAGFCWLAITAWGMVLVMLWAVGLSQICFLRQIQSKITIEASIVRILWGTTLWCLLESLWSRGALWWSTLALTQSPTNLGLLQLSQFSGSITVVAIVVLLNGLLAEMALHWRQGHGKTVKTFAIAWILLVVTLGTFSYFLNQRPIADNPQEKLKIGIIQGNIPNEIKLYPEGWRKAIAGYTSGYEQLARAGVDIVLTPETALPYSWPDIVANSSFYRAILTEKTPVWLGAFGQTQDRQGEHITNSLFTITGTGQLYSQFNKVKLVPLGEYVPFSQFLGQFIDRLSPLKADLIPGKAGQLMPTPWGLAAVGICYESAFAEHFRGQVAQGAQFIITVANNAHYSTVMPAQHHAQDVLRAIESDRWLARATNTGYSAIIDPRGHTRWQSGINTYELHTGTLYRRQTQTLYVRWGDWLTPSLLVLSAIAWGWIGWQPGNIS